MARFANPVSIWKLLRRPRSQPMRAASLRWNTEWRIIEMAPTTPTESNATGVTADSAPPEPILANPMK